MHLMARMTPCPQSILYGGQRNFLLFSMNSTCGIGQICPPNKGGSLVNRQVGRPSTRSHNEVQEKLLWAIKLKLFLYFFFFSVNAVSVTRQFLVAVDPVERSSN